MSALTRSRIGRTVSRAATTTRLMPPATRSTWSVPMVAAAGPARAWPTGIIAREPATSYAWMRLRTSAGTCVWTLVAHITLQKAMPAPATAAPAAMAATPRPAPTVMGKPAKAKSAIAPARSMRRGRSRSASRPPTTVPAPRAELIRP
ncbi:hypothetical protein WKI71_38245 [Streptomyces sp. MS1.AVA.1]|uniref:Uncharacterized protein n=1 Tax=Streptomyces machairae TaxID=3134109 RepID=A0ABU8UTX1_9ACTN